MNVSAPQEPTLIDAGTQLSRRALLRRVGSAAAVAVAAATALAVADADRGENGTRPLFSLSPWATYDVDRHVAELRRGLAMEGRITLVGHSIGARLAIAYAARYPEQIERLVLVSLPYFGDAEQAKRFFRDKGANGWIWTHLIPMALMCLFSRRLFGGTFRYLVTSVPRVVAEDLTQMTWRSSTSTIWGVIYDYDLAADMRRIPAEIPFLCLHGDRDDSAPLGRMRELQSVHPNCVIRVQRGATHQLPLFHQAWLRSQIASAFVA